MRAFAGPDVCLEAASFPGVCDDDGKKVLLAPGKRAVGEGGIILLNKKLHTCARACMHTHTNTHMNTCIDACMHAYTVRMHNAHGYERAGVRSHTNTHTHALTCMHANIIPTSVNSLALSHPSPARPLSY